MLHFCYWNVSRLGIFWDKNPRHSQSFNFLSYIRAERSLTESVGVRDIMWQLPYYHGVHCLWAHCIDSTGLLQLTEVIISFLNSRIHLTGTGTSGIRHEISKQPPKEHAELPGARTMLLWLDLLTPLWDWVFIQNCCPMSSLLGRRTTQPCWFGI